MSVSSEDELVRRLREGDPDAFADAFHQFADRLYRLALSIVRSPDDAEDVVQETFIALARHLDGFEGRARLGTWLYRVTYNGALQRLRSRRRAEHRSARVPDEDRGPAIEDLRNSAPGVEARAETAEVQDEVERALATLPESLRTTFLLRDIEGLSTAETAELLEVTPGAVKVRLHRARLAIRELLAPVALPPTTSAAGIACADVIERMSDYLDGELEPETAARVEAHVAECNHCRITIDSTTRALEVAGQRRTLVIPAGRSGQLFARLEAIYASRTADPAG